MKNQNNLAANKWKNHFSGFQKIFLKCFIYSKRTDVPLVYNNSILSSQNNLQWSEMRSKCSVQLTKSECSSSPILNYPVMNFTNTVEKIRQFGTDWIVCKVQLKIIKIVNL